MLSRKNYWADTRFRGTITTLCSALALGILFWLHQLQATYPSTVLATFSLWAWLSGSTRKQEIKALKHELQQTRHRCDQLGQHFSKTAEISKIAAWEYLIEEQQLQWAPNSCQHIGLDLDIHAVDSLEAFTSIIIPQDREKLHRALTELTENCTPFNLDLRIPFADKTSKWVRITANWDKFSLQTPRIYGVVQNITQFKSTELKLLENQERFITAFENAPIGLALIALDGRWLKINSKVCEILGYTEEELLNLDYQSTTHPDDLQTDQDLKDEILKGMRKSFNMDKRYIHKQGHIILTHIAVSMVHHPDGTPKYFVSQIQDVTTQRINETNIRESEKRLSSLIHNMPAAVYRCEIDEDWSMIFMSEFIEEISGYPFSDFIQNQIRSFTDIIHPEDRQYVTREVHSAIEKKQSFNLEYRILHADGSTHWIHEKGSRNFDTRLNKPVLDGVILDITEHKKTARELEDLNFRFQVAQSSAKIGIWEHDPQNQSFKLDGTMYELYGLNPETDDFTFQRWGQAVHPEDQESTFQAVAKSLKERSSFDHTFRILWPDQSIHYIRAFAEVIKDSQTGELRMIGTNQDITHQVTIDYELSKANNRFSLAVQSANIGIWEIDLISEKLHWDEQMHKLHHCAPDATPPNLDAWLDRVHPEDRFQFLKLLHDSEHPEKQVNWDFRITFEDGSTHYMRANALILLDRNNHPIKAIGSQREVTQQKQAEEAILYAKEKAEHADRSKSAFLASMSHEIRTPMNAVIGLTQILQQTDLDEEQREYIDIIETSGNGLLSLIDDILDYSKIEAGKLDLKISRVVLGELLEACVETMAEPAHRKGLDLALDLAPQVPEALNIDPHRLRQVLINLLSNAIKFTSKGHVRLSVHLDRNQPGECLLHFTVTDTGIGIPEDKQNLLFASFSQIDNSNNRRNTGTGLGLAISKKLIQMMNGSMWVESKEGKGASFHFTLACPTCDPHNPDNPDFHRYTIGLLELPKATEEATHHLLEATGASYISLNNLHEVDELNKQGKYIHCLIIHDQWVQQHAAEMELPENRAILQHTPGILLKLIGSNTSNPLFKSRINLPVRPKPLHLALNRILQSHQHLPQKNTSIHPQSKQHFPHLNILVAEDQKANQMVIKLMLERLGCPPTITHNGQEALQALEENTYDIVLMDIQMPVMDGLEATVKIMERFPEESRPIIIALTAGVLPSDREKAAKAGIQEYLPKPLQWEDLVNTIKAMDIRISKKSGIRD